MCYGNLRGIREASKTFAVPTYLFSGIVLADDHHRPGPGDLRRPAARPLPLPGQYTGHPYSGLITFGMVFVLLRAFANGGSSLTGIEAVSNAVSAFKPPEGLNARKLLVTEGLHPGLPGRRDLLAGPRDPLRAVHERRADRAVPGGQAVFGRHGVGQVLFVAVQAAPR